jgi:hypothetical protein
MREDRALDLRLECLLQHRNDDGGEEPERHGCRDDHDRGIEPERFAEERDREAPRHERDDRREQEAHELSHDEVDVHEAVPRDAVGLKQEERDRADGAEREDVDAVHRQEVRHHGGDLHERTEREEAAPARAAAASRDTATRARSGSRTA